MLKNTSIRRGIYWPNYNIPVWLRYLKSERADEVNAIINMGCNRQKKDETEPLVKNVEYVI